MKLLIRLRQLIADWFGDHVAEKLCALAEELRELREEYGGQCVLQRDFVVLGLTLHLQELLVSPVLHRQLPLL